METLTDMQRRVYLFMSDYFEENDQLPSCKAIAANFLWDSENAAYEAQKILERKGWIEKNEAGKYRFSRSA